jgi:hypothetical protein
MAGSIPAIISCPLDKYALTAVRLLFFIAAAHHLPYNTGALDELLAAHMNYKRYVTKVTQIPKSKPRTGHCHCRRFRTKID